MGRNPPRDNVGRPTSSRNPGQAKTGQGEQVLGKSNPGDGPPKDRVWPGWLIKGSAKKKRGGGPACQQMSWVLLDM